MVSRNGPDMLRFARSVTLLRLLWAGLSAANSCIISTWETAVEIVIVEIIIMIVILTIIMIVIRTIFMMAVMRTCLLRFLFLLLVKLVFPRGVEGENTLTLKEAPGDIRPWSFLHLQEESGGVKVMAGGNQEVR